MEDEFAVAAGEALAGQMEEQKAMDASFRQNMEDSYAQVGEAKEALMAGFLNKNKGPEYPPEVLEIANALIAQPRLIQPTQVFLAQMVERINQAVNDIVAEALGPTGP